MSTDTPAQWRMVPVEPTEAMHVAAVRTIVNCTGNDDFPPRVWAAMLAASPQPTAAPVAWVYWHPSETTYDGPDTNHKKAVSFFTDDTRREMAREGWQLEPLVYASAAPTQAVAELVAALKQKAHDVDGHCDSVTVSDLLEALSRAPGAGTPNQLPQR